MINMCLEQTNKQLTIIFRSLPQLHYYLSRYGKDGEYFQTLFLTLVNDSYNTLRIVSFNNDEISTKLEVINLLHKMKHKKHATTSNKDYILSKVFCVWFNILDLHFTQHFFRREIFILPLIKDIVARNLRTIFSHGITINSSFISNFSTKVGLYFKSI